MRCGAGGGCARAPSVTVWGMPVAPWGRAGGTLGSMCPGEGAGACGLRRSGTAREGRGRERGAPCGCVSDARDVPARCRASFAAGLSSLALAALSSCIAAAQAAHPAHHCFCRDQPNLNTTATRRGAGRACRPALAAAAPAAAAAPVVRTRPAACWAARTPAGWPPGCPAARGADGPTRDMIPHATLTAHVSGGTAPSARRPGAQRASAGRAARVVRGRARAGGGPGLTCVAAHVAFRAPQRSAPRSSVTA